MANSRQPTGRADPAPPPAPAEDLTPLERFSREMAERFPGRVVQRYVMPAKILQCCEVFFLEVNSDEELQAAIMADSLASSAEKASMKLMLESERREMIRLSLVGMGKRTPGGAVRYEHKNNDGAPLDEISTWPSKAWVALQNYYGETNGVPQAELSEGIKGALIIGAFAPPNLATLASAATGKSGGNTGEST